VIPIGARALAWISKYLEESRPSHDPGKRRWPGVPDAHGRAVRPPRSRAQIDGQSRAKGVLIPLSDLLIGATALEVGYRIVTASFRHFQLIPELNVIQLGGRALFPAYATFDSGPHRQGCASPRHKPALLDPGRCRPSHPENREKGGLCSGVPPCRRRATGFSENRS
jgi:hypothetical protein